MSLAILAQPVIGAWADPALSQDREPDRPPPQEPKKD